MAPLSQGRHGVDYDTRHDAVAAKGGVGTMFLPAIRGGLILIPFTAPIDERTHDDCVWRAEGQLRAIHPGETLYWCCLRVGRKFTSITEQEQARNIRQMLSDGELEGEIKFDGRSLTLSGPVHFKLQRRAYNCVGWCCLE